MYYKGRKKLKADKKPKKLVKYLTQTQVNELLERIKLDNKRNYLIVLTLWKTGMRNAELCNLRKGHIKFQESKIVIHQGKGNRDRWVPLEANLSNLLSFYCSDLANNDLLFPITTTSIRNIVTKYRLDAQITPHTFRHSFAVHCLKSGMNIRSLQKILGHSDLATTAVYLDLIGEDIMDDFKKIKW